MLTVRFPTGIAVTYNTAMFLKSGASSWRLYTADPDRGGQWVASIQVSAGASVEAVGACRIENPVEDLTSDHALRRVTAEVADLARRYPSQVAALKRALTQFDSRTRSWRER
jgi:hypothetical protein